MKREAQFLASRQVYNCRISSGWPRATNLCGLRNALGLLAFQRLFARRLLPANIHLDLLRLGFLLFRQLYLQHALIVVGLNAFLVDCVRESESPREGAILPLH